MSFVIRQGDIFQSSADVLVNAVNCIGIMGGGIAKAFADRFPDCVPPYVTACRNKALAIGRGLVWQDPQSPIFIVQAPTMIRPGSKAQLSDIKKTVEWIAHALVLAPTCTIAIPALGCGIGGLDWEDVANVIRTRFSAPDVSRHCILFYAPWGVDIEI